MTHTTLAECEMRDILPAVLPIAEHFLVDFRERSRELLSTSESFRAELMLREALTNAIVHGCHLNPLMKVRCCLRIKERRLLIVVEDDGKGFDWRTARDSLADPFDCSGRGLEILRTYANHVRYSAMGNAVMITKRFDERDNK